MTATTLPPLHLPEPVPGLGRRCLRWSLVAAAHGALLYGLLAVTPRPEEAPADHTVTVRLLPQQATREAPAPVQLPPKPAQPVHKAAPLAPQPVLTSRAPEAPAPFAVAPQPPAPVPAPVAAPPAAPVAAPAASRPVAPAPVSAARYDADYLHNPPPAYPAFSRRVGEEGKVLLRVKVSAEGSPLEVEVQQSSGFPRLDNAARETVARYRFVPARRGDEAIESWVTVPITFRLQ